MTSKPPFDGVQSVPVKDVFDLQMGKTPSRNVTEYWNNGDHDWVSIKDLGSYGKYVGRTKETISNLGVAESRIKVVPENTLIMSFKLSLGKTAITVAPTYTNEAIMAFLNKKAFPIDLNYMYHQFSAKDWTAGTNIAVMGKTLNKKTLGAAHICVPNIETQREIASRLDYVCEQIRLVKQQLALLDELVKSRFVEMFDGAPWQVVRASDVMTSFRNGVSPSKDGDIHERVLTLSAITQGYFDETAWKDGTFKELPASDKRVSDSDFYICRGNGNKQLVGAGEFADANHPELVFPDTMIAGTINKNLVRKPFLTQVWKHPSVRRQIEAKARTTNGTLKINQKIVSEIRFPLPPLDVQDEFASFIERVDKLRFVVIEFHECRCSPIG